MFDLKKGDKVLVEVAGLYGPAFKEGVFVEKTEEVDWVDHFTKEVMVAKAFVIRIGNFEQRVHEEQILKRI